MHPEPEIAARSRMHSFTAGFKKPFRKKNKDSPKLSPRPMPKNTHSPVAPRRTVEPSLSSPLLKNKAEKQPEGTSNPLQKNGAEQQPNNVPRVTPRPKRPPPPKPPAPYRKKSATYVQLEENSAFQPENGASNKREADLSNKRSAHSSTEKSEGNSKDEEPEVVPFLYEVPISQHSTLETIREGDGTKSDDILKPVAPPRRRKNNGASPKATPKLPHDKIPLGKIPKAASVPVIHNGDSSSNITTHKTSDVVVAVQPPKYTEEELEKCSVSDQHLHINNNIIIYFIREWVRVAIYSLRRLAVGMSEYSNWKEIV